MEEIPYSSTAAATQENEVEDDSLVRISGLPVLTGWRLALATLSLCLGLFLSALETTIIATSLVTISSDLGHFDKASWIVVAYLLTYTGFLIIFTRLSDIFGRKQTLLVAVGFFTVFSLACGAAQTLEQLIIFRSLQGIGGSGIYSLAMAAVLEITPVPYFSHTSAAVSAATACSSVLGPIVGGAITSHTTWRWVFWLNIPAGVIIMALIIFIFPRNIGQQKYSKGLYSKVDFPGVVLSLVGSVLLVFALESGGNQYPWNSGAVIVTLIISGISWIAFTIWEGFLSMKASRTSMMPIFPARLVSHRAIAATMASGFFTGFPFMVTIINLPQRFQIVNGAIFSKSKENISSYLLAFSNFLQILGTGLMSSLPVSGEIPASQYGFQVILGFAFGMGLVSLLIIARTEVSHGDNAITIGAITQVRVLGGIIGLSIVQAILLSTLRSGLSSGASPILTSPQLSSILSSTSNIVSLPPAAAQATREAYGNASNLQMRIVMGFAGVSLVVGAFTWRRHPIAFADVVKGKSPGDIRESKRVRGDEKTVQIHDLDKSDSDTLPRGQAENKQATITLTP